MSAGVIHATHLVPVRALEPARSSRTLLAEIVTPLRLMPLGDDARDIGEMRAPWLGPRASAPVTWSEGTRWRPLRYGFRQARVSDLAKFLGAPSLARHLPSYRDLALTVERTPFGKAAASCAGAPDGFRGDGDFESGVAASRRSLLRFVAEEFRADGDMVLARARWSVGLDLRQPDGPATVVVGHARSDCAPLLTVEAGELKGLMDAFAPLARGRPQGARDVPGDPGTRDERASVLAGRLAARLLEDALGNARGRPGTMPDGLSAALPALRLMDEDSRLGLLAPADAEGHLAFLAPLLEMAVRHEAGRRGRAARAPWIHESTVAHRYLCGTLLPVLATGEVPEPDDADALEGLAP